MAVTSTVVPGMLRYAEREARVWSRLWRGSVFSGVVTPILFLGAMGLGLGGLVDENAGTVDGLAYLTFVTPGLLAASAAQNAAGAALWPVMGNMKWMRIYHAAVATPLRPSEVYLGYMAWQSVYIGVHAVPFVVVAALLGGIPSAWGILAIPAAALCALAFCAPLAAFVATQDSDASFPTIMRVLVLPLFLFSATFFPLDQLPVGIRPIAWVSPLWHGVELCRGATTGSIEPWAVLLHVGVLGAFTAVGAAWGSRTFTRRLTP
ncbi:MAG: ABC transporter permease [Acidimicrobiales bacterium]